MKSHPQEDLDKFLDIADEKIKEKLEILSIDTCRAEVSKELDTAVSFLNKARKKP